MKKVGIICAVVLTATLTGCGMLDEKSVTVTSSGTSTQSEENGFTEETTKAPVKPTGNMVIKDEAGNVVMTIDDVESVEATKTDDESSVVKNIVNIKFTDEGTKKFEKVSQDNIGKMLEIYVDDELVTSPRVNEPIKNGKAVITGDFTLEEVERIADKIQG